MGLFDWGRLNVPDYKAQIDNASSAAKAREILKKAMGETNKAGGVSDGDQKAIVQLLNYYANKYNANVQGLLDIWDPSKNHINMTEHGTALKESNAYFDNYFTNGYQPNNIDGKKLKASGDYVTLNGNKQNVWEVDGKQYVWEGNGKGSGQYITREAFEKKYGSGSSNLSNEELEAIINGNNNSSGGSGSGSGSGGSGSGGNGGGGGGSYSSSSTAPKVNKIDWQNKSIDEMAKIVGMDKYSYEDILKLYDDATNAKFNEFDTQLKRAQAENLRTLQGQYDTYLDTLRENRANAISNGMTKGSAAAQQLASMYAAQQTINESQQGLHDTIYDTIQQRGTKLEENKLLAQQERRDVEKYLGDLRGTYEANSVAELAARLSADSQIRAAQIGANATTRAAQIGASAAGSGNSATNDLTFKYYLAQANGDYATAVNNYIAQIERDSRTNQYVAQNPNK